MTPVQEESFEINWYYILAIAYTIGSVLLITQFIYDFYNLNRVIKGKSIQHQADYKFIDTTENIAPFSYFNTIVYNSSLYSESEMESILEHEKVHSEQYHTVDVLITRFFCIFFWFNPFIWLYKNAILQNLEFIADSEATKNLSDKKAYQLTLLKITTQENCVVLTNHFYQSLIKKRIVMLNKNQSKKWNLWKYALVLPVLVAFMVLFQIEVIAQEKTKPKQTIEKKLAIIDFIITKNTSNQEIKEQCEKLNKTFNVNLTFFNIKRNSKGEIINIDGKFEDQTGSASCNQSENPIKPFRFYYNPTNKEMGFDMDISNSKNNKGRQSTSNTISSPALPPKVKTIKIAPSVSPAESTATPPALPPTVKSTTPPALPPKVSTIKFTYPTEKNQIIASNSNNKTVSINEPMIIIDGVKADSKTTVNSLNKEENNKTYFQINGPVTLPPVIIMNGVKINSISSVNEINPDAIKSMNILKGKTAEDKYGKDGKNGVIEITTKENAVILKESPKKD
ncbi:hypothetical protein FEM08_14250 [Flavobacterium gilvum]|nr:hypothetical protein FEM08_14250 [Flavobacterium gilvum]